jgi:hypothetical protein
MMSADGSGRLSPRKEFGVAQLMAKRGLAVAATVLSELATQLRALLR